MTENNAVIKIIAQHTKEFSVLEAKFKILGKKHVNLLNAHIDLNLLSAQLKKENKQLRNMLKKWTDENTMLQESLDGAQREIERLEDRILESIMPGRDLR